MKEGRKERRDGREGRIKINEVRKKVKKGRIERR